MSEHEAKHEETLVEAESIVEDDIDEFHPFDEMTEEFMGSDIRRATGPDGLPTNFFEDAESTIPALSCETLVCMEDRSLFVVRDEKGRISEEHKPSEVERAPNGKWYVKDGETGAGTEVEPVRPQCKHYVRQVSTFEANTNNRIHLRLCAGRRTTEGTFMTVRDAAIYACSMREPRDLSTEESIIETFDEQKVRDGKNRGLYSMFKQEID